MNEEYILYVWFHCQLLIADSLIDLHVHDSTVISKLINSLSIVFVKIKMCFQPWIYQGIISTPPHFSNFIWDPVKYFWKKLKILKASICDDLSNHCWSRPYPKLWGKYKTPSPRFHRFLYKNLFFFVKCLICLSVILINNCLLLLFLQDFELKQRENVTKKFRCFSKCSISRIIDFHILCYNLVELWPRIAFHQYIQHRSL